LFPRQRPRRPRPAVSRRRGACQKLSMCSRRVRLFMDIFPHQANPADKRREEEPTTCHKPGAPSGKRASAPAVVGAPVVAQPVK
jgi:hypothetical protein